MGVRLSRFTQEFIRAIELAASIFVESHNKSNIGKFCKIGDTTCKV